MTGIDPSRVTISTSARLSPEEIASRSFPSGMRGLVEADVRAWLKRIAEEVQASRENERRLGVLIEELERQLRLPPVVGEEQLLSALGEETTRVLRAAQDAADEIRSKAQERADRNVHEAQTEALRIREEVEAYRQQRVSEADLFAADAQRDAIANAAEIRSDAERFSDDHRRRATHDVATELEDARVQGREMLAEAKEIRERVLADLGRRRALVQSQIEELRTGRDRLIEVYRVVRRTFDEATEALGSVEARAAAQLAVGGGVYDYEREIPPTTAGGVDVPATDVPVTPNEPELDEPQPDEPSPAEPQPVESPAADIDALFARIRSAAPSDEPKGLSEETAEQAPQDIAEAQSTDPPIPESPTGDAASFRSRDDAITGLLRGANKAVKRALQDEQNDIFDGLRKNKGKPTAASVLPEFASQVESRIAILKVAIDKAYLAGANLGGVTSAESAAPDELILGLVRASVTDLRDRLEETITNTDADDDLASRIGARYREWKSQRAEKTTRALLETAFTAGTFDAIGEGALMRWCVEADETSPDCQDNALQPTPRGLAFPTGHFHPPAHDGCRCLLVPA